MLQIILSRNSVQMIYVGFRDTWASQVALVVETLLAMQEAAKGFDPWVGKIPERRHGNPL